VRQRGAHHKRERGSRYKSMMRFSWNCDLFLNYKSNQILIFYKRKKFLVLFKKTVNLSIIFLSMFLENIRLKIARRRLRKKTAHLKRQKMLHDFASAKSIGIICTSADAKSVQMLKDFLHFIAQKDIKYWVLGYFNVKKIPENFLFWKEMDFFTQKELNFLFIPKSPTVDKFIANPFDMLINCSMEEYFPIEYIMQSSVAKCKVGMNDNKYNDLSLELKKKEIGYFLENVKLYLSNLRKSE
jgi:hypothetical protein